MGFFKNLFRKINHHLDREIQKADLKASRIYPENTILKFIWGLLFFRTRIHSSAKTRSCKTFFAKKIYHVVNFIDPNKIKNESLRHRVKLAIEAINKHKSSHVTIIAASEKEESVPPGWEFLKLNRSAKSELKSPKDFAFLKDMLNEASLMSSEEDMILYTNMDCIISESMYKDILDKNEDITEYLRRDVPSQKTLDLIYKSDHSIYEIGVDGLAIRKNTYEDFKEKLPDFIIGEPHWDTCYSGILNKHFYVAQNSKDLFHILHDQEWDDSNLSFAGEYNKGLYINSIHNGLMNDVIISLRKQTVFIYLKHSLGNQREQEAKNKLKSLGLSKSLDFIFCEFMDETIEPLGPKLGFKYFNIYNKNKFTKALNQKNAISNILLHSFSNYRNIAILYEGGGKITHSDVKNIQLHLQSDGLFSQKHVYAITNKDLQKKELDIYGDNPYDIKDVFLNDEGLIELLNNKYEHRSF
jgi:hypothetical protein